MAGGPSRIPFTHGVAGRALKTKVPSNVGSSHEQRFSNALWTYRLGQLTSSNMTTLKKSGATSFTSLTDSAGSGKGQASGEAAGGSSAGGSNASPVKSDLQPHALHKFSGESDWSLLVAVPASSVHARNVLDCQKVSFMFGHTDPQLFQWFQQLGTLPPRGMLSGPAEVLSGDLLAEAWESTFSRHPIIHSIAQDMWEKKASKTQDEEVRIEQRIREEDEKRMRRMSSSDWRSKFQDRERNPSAKEDEERPIYVIKPEVFTVLRVKPEMKLWTGMAGDQHRMWEPNFSGADPLCRSSMRFMRMLNLARQKLVPSLNMNFSLKLTNAFIFEIDCNGLWAMGTQENFAGKNGQVREECVLQNGD